jgi:release factor glutamine methyltransferase
MTTLSAIMTEAAESFMHVGIPTPQLDARVLMNHSLGITSETLMNSGSKNLSETEASKYRKLVERRLKREPIAYITGRKEFWSMNFNVSSSTLVPRPDSETLVEAVLADFPRGKSLRVLDLGTGSGCLLLSILSEFANATGVGVDLSPEAVKIATENAEKLGLSERVVFKVSDWATNLNGEFDIIISNPPYIPSQQITVLDQEVRDYEPRAALDGGKDGLDCYRIIIPQTARLITESGKIYFEIGNGQDEEVRKIGTASGLNFVKEAQDLAGTIRVISFSK